MLKSRTFVATPAYRGDVVMQYAHSIVRDAVLAITRGHFVEAPYFHTHTLIHAARSHCVKLFMGGDWDYLMFIDADTGWQPDALGDILDLPADMDVVGGICHRRDDDRVYPFNAMPGVPLKFPVCEVDTLGACFMRITRKCIERTLRAYPGDRPFDYMPDPDHPELLTGEDFAFCRRVRGAGGKVYGKFDIQFDHVGPKTWTGRASDDLADKEGFLIPPRQEVVAPSVQPDMFESLALSAA